MTGTKLARAMTFTNHWLEGRRREAQMLQFKLTCPRHRLEYIDIMQRNGVLDPMEMERLRLRFVSLVSKTYPAGYFDHIEDQSCMGCAFEESGPACRQWAIDALTSLIRGTDPPPMVVKTWVDQAYRQG